MSWSFNAIGHCLKERCPETGEWRWKYLTTQVSVSHVYLKLITE